MSYINETNTLNTSEEETVEDIVNKKLDELLRICLDNNIPFFATVALEENLKTKYINRTVAPVELGVILSEDRITKYAASLNENFILKIKKAEESTASGDMFGDIVEEEY